MGGLKRHQHKGKGAYPKAREAGGSTEEINKKRAGHSAQNDQRAGPGAEIEDRGNKHGNAQGGGKKGETKTRKRARQAAENSKNKKTKERDMEGGARGTSRRRRKERGHNRKRARHGIRVLFLKLPKRESNP